VLLFPQYLYSDTIILLNILKRIHFNFLFGRKKVQFGCIRFLHAGFLDIHKKSSCWPYQKRMFPKFVILEIARILKIDSFALCRTNTRSISRSCVYKSKPIPSCLEISNLQYNSNNPNKQNKRHVNTSQKNSVRFLIPERLP